MTSRSINVQNSTVLVTGANRGIGKSIVEALIKEGVAKVYAGARNPDSLTPLVVAHGDRVVPIQLDVTNKEDITNAAAKASDIDLLINNAGVLLGGDPDGNNDEAKARTEMEVNYFGVLNMSNAFAPVLAANGGGAIVNVASVASMVNFPAFSTYCASKAAVWSLSIGLRGQLAGQNTRIVTVHPGPIATDMTTEFDMDKAPPSAVADAIIAGLADGTDEILTDEMGRGLYAQWREDPRAVEAQVAEMAV